MMDQNIGKKLDGRYEIVELIGVGGMADVYKATDIIDDKTVAVKILKNKFADNEDFLRRFRNESKAIAVLSHPNIVKILDVNFTDKIQYIVMEYIDGITLKEFMEQQGVLKWKDAIHFTVQILRALQHAHDRGIVHRDIKPQNIMLFQDGTIKVMDFGIARFAREEGKTLSDKAIGSVHYISPEQARGEITDEKSDIYSVGVMLYEMLTGQKPFDGDNPVSVALMHMQYTPKNPKAINDTIPEGLEEIVLRAMQREPEKRYHSASEMIKDIDEFKKNPSIVFEYKYLGDSEGSTKYFTKVESPAPKKKAKPKPKPKPEPEYEDDDDDDDDDDEPSKVHSFVGILLAITAAVVIVVAFFIAAIFMKRFDEKVPEYTMPNLIGMDYYDAKADYPNLKINIISSNEYTEYEKNQIFYQDLDPGRSYKQGGECNVKVSAGIKMVSVPDVYTLEYKVAQNQLLNEGFTPVVKWISDNLTADYVVRTSPGKNELVSPGSTVTIFVSMGPDEKNFFMPNVLTQNIEDAKRLLESEEYGLIVKVEDIDSAEPAGTVVGQSIPEREITKPKTEVVLQVSSGESPATTVDFTLNIPYGSNGSFTFRMYIDGEVVNETKKDNISYVNDVTMSVTNRGLKTVIAEIEYNETGKRAKLASYSVDFVNGTILERTYYNEEAFDELVSVTTTATTPYYTTSPSYEYPYPSYSTTAFEEGTTNNFGYEPGEEVQTSLFTDSNGNVLGHYVIPKR